MNLNQIAKQIVEQNQYLTLATIGRDNLPWVSPVVYCHDADYHFYFISLPTSKHIQNIQSNSKVSFAIFDSRQNWGEGVGLQIEGIISKVNPTRLPKVIALYLNRNWPHINNKLESYLKGFQQLLKNKTYRAYEIIPTKVWMNDPREKIDVRTQVQLT